MRNKIEEKLIKLAYNNQGIVFGIFSAMAIASVCLLIYGLLILGGYV
jgi:hypothetical protein